MAMKSDSKKRAPLRKAQNWKKEVPGMAGKQLVLVILVVVAGLIFSGLQSAVSGWVRIGVTLALGLMLLLFYYTDGVNKGSVDAGMSRHIAKLEKEGRKISVQEEAGCYHPLKAVCAGLLAFALPLVLAIFLAVTAKPYAYSLQDLPVWLSGAYGVREDVVGPLAAYMQPAGATVTDWIRVLVRLLMLVFVNLFEDPQRMTQMIDQSAPLFISLYPLAYLIGYLRGPSTNAKMEKQNKKAKKAAVRKQKKSNLVNELLGENQVPHYGHKRESDKPKKKELI